MPGEVANQAKPSLLDRLAAQLYGRGFPMKDAGRGTFSETRPRSSYQSRRRACMVRPSLHHLIAAMEDLADSGTGVYPSAVTIPRPRLFSPDD